MYSPDNMRRIGREVQERLTLPRGAILGFLAVGGSYAYGTAHEGSDLDLRGIFIEPGRKFLTLESVKDTIDSKEPDVTLYELGKFCALAAAGNPNILEILYSPIELHAEALTYFFLDDPEMFLSQRLRLTYGGYAKSQMKRVERGETHGRLTEARRTKHLMHCFRLLEQGTKALERGTIDIRVQDPTGLRSWVEEATDEEVLDRFNTEIEKLDTVDSDLPPEPDYGEINQILFGVRMGFMTEED